MVGFRWFRWAESGSRPVWSTGGGVGEWGTVYYSDTCLIAHSPRAVLGGVNGEGENAVIQ